MEVQDELVFSHALQVSGILPAFTAGNPVGQNRFLGPDNPLDQEDDASRSHNASHEYQAGRNGNCSLFHASTDDNSADNQDYKSQVTGGIEALVILQFFHQLLFHVLKHSFKSCLCIYKKAVHRNGVLP